MSKLAIFTIVVFSAFHFSVKAANPFLNLDSSKEDISHWNGFEWGDQVQASAEAGSPIIATVKRRRIANMSWGQIVRYQFEVPTGRKIQPLYVLVRDNVILELASEDMMHLIGTIAGMKQAPSYEPGDVRAQSKVGKLTSEHKPWRSEVITLENKSTWLTSHSSGHFTKQVWEKGKGLVEYASGYGARKDGFRLMLSKTGEEKFSTNNENLGGVKFNLTEKQVTALISGKPEIGKAEYWDAVGEWYQSWKWLNLGLEVGFSSAKEKDPKTVVSVEISGQSKLKTARGLGIGSSEQAVRKQYGAAISKEDSEAGKSLVVGSIYDGLIFSLKSGKVVRIFLGAAAE